jgi:peptide/nickel transport system permease protein
MARMHLGEKYVQQKAIQKWKKNHGYDKPLFFNLNQSGLKIATDTLFFQKSLKLFALDFGRSDGGRDISYDIGQRMWPSFTVALPILLMGLWLNIVFAMCMAFFKTSYIDLSGVIVCIIMMSISSLFYIVGGQYLFGKVLKLVPISGFSDGFNGLKFVILPALVGVIGGMGSGARWYRTIFLEEMEKDYIKTARAKGLRESSVLFLHVLKNAMLPILTGIVVIIPSLFMGSLILESFFGIPGLGSYVIDAITAQDFAIVRSMVFLGSILYIVGLILTDISYTLVDPRIRLQ